MKIKELKHKHPLIYKRALECQVEQGNKANDNIILSARFDWDKTVEGFPIWDEVDNKNFKPFYDFHKQIKESEQNISKTMNRESQYQIFDKFVSDMRETIFSKSDDYANDKDTLAAFRQVAELVGITQEQVCLNFMATKLVRLCNLVDKKDPNNESIDDNLKDLANYCVLLKMIKESK